MYKQQCIAYLGSRSVVLLVVSSALELDLCIPMSLQNLSSQIYDVLGTTLTNFMGEIIGVAIQDKAPLLDIRFGEEWMLRHVSRHSYIGTQWVNDRSSNHL